MSIVRCDKCSRAIDSDDDAECFVQITDYGDDGAFKDAIWCEPCRERFMDQIAAEPSDEARARYELGDE